MRMGKLFLGGFMLVCMVLFAGCGKVQTEQTENTQMTQVSENSEIQDYAYLPEFMELEFAEEAEGSNLWVNLVRLGEDKIFYGIRVYAAEEQTQNMYIHYRDFQDLQQLHKIPPEVFSAGEDLYVETCAFDSQKQFYLVWSSSKQDGYFLSKYDRDYHLLYTKDLSDIWVNDMNSYLHRILVDEEGRIFGTCQNVLYILTEEGELEKTIKLGTSNMSNLFFLEDGRLFMSYYDREGRALAEINIAEGKREDPLENLPYGCKEIWAGRDGKVLLDRAGKLWEYDLTTEELTELFAWSDVSIQADSITGLKLTGDGEIIVLCTKHTEVPLVPECEVVYLKKVDKAMVPVKENITVATLYQSDGYLTEAVADFNRKSNQYRVEIKSYMDEGTKWSQSAYDDALNRFHEELVNGEAGDIINLKNMDWRNLAEKGALEELTPYMSNEGGVSKKDFLDSVVKAYEEDGKCYTIPRGFTIETLMGKASVVGSREDWSLEKVRLLAEQYPEAAMINMGNPYMLLQFCMQYGNESFVNYETASCDFDNQAFIQILEFCKRGGTRQTPNTDLYSNAKMNRVLLGQVSIQSVEAYQMYCQLFEGEGGSVGYPSISGGGQAVLTGEEMLAIASGSKKKEAAWEFMESFLQQEPWSHFALPTLLSYYEAEIAEACKVEYAYDEEGKLLYDKEGNPLQKVKTTWGYGSFEAEIYAATEKEIAEFRGLLEYADSNQMEEKIRVIINEEVGAYFEGQKEASEVAKIIQNRVQLYLFENA